MLAILHRPLPARRLPVALLGLVLAVGGYCLLYSALAQNAETPGEAFAWASINVAPWLLAFEAAKRRRALRWRAFVLAVALTGSLALGALAGTESALGFELLRRLPALLLVAGLLGLGDLAARPEAAEAPVDLPLPPDRIDWVAAAGNYVEIRGCGRILVSRASLASVERRLGGHGFVRIHRSRLVRREAIARVRTADVILHDGTSLAIGKRYRSALRG